MSDPSGFVTNPPSKYVKIQNTARDEMNGSFGLVIGFSSERGRYILLLCQTGSQVMLKPENLVPTSQLEQYQAQFQQLKNDPRIRQEIRQYYDKAQRQLGGTKPEYAAAAVGVILLFCMYFIGFTKVLMLLSMMVLIGLIVAPDVQTFGIRKWNLIARNFPRRCRETIEQTVPAARGRVSDRIALGLVVVMLLMVGKTLVTPNTPSRSAAPPAQQPNSAFPPTYSNTMIDDKFTSSMVDLLQEAYRLGFADATDAAPYGSSSLEALTQAVKTAATAPPTAATIPDIDYDPYGVPPPSSSPPRSGFGSGGGFGIGTAMSLLLIGRTVYQLGMHDGTFNVQLALANLRNIPIYQQGLLGYSVYNVFKAFF
eukprot:scaffold871_cov130-Cylindrotheca_fusiformis.AAC.13